MTVVPSRVVITTLVRPLLPPTQPARVARYYYHSSNHITRHRLVSGTTTTLLVPPRRCASHSSRSNVKLLPPPRDRPVHPYHETPTPTLPPKHHETRGHYTPRSSSTAFSTPHIARKRRGSSIATASDDRQQSMLRRWFSSTTRQDGLLPGWWRYWSGNKTPRGRQLPPLASFLDASTNQTGRMLKATNEPRLRCTEFNENGNVTLVNGEFKKSELIAKVGEIHDRRLYQSL